MVEHAHRRMDTIERKLQRFNNPAPTVPQYDLQVAAVIIDTPTLDSIQVKLNAAGSPIDQVKCSLCTDASGFPGSELVSDIQTVSSSVVYSFDMGGFILDLGIPYWIVLERTGSLDSSNAYNIHGNDATGAPTNYFYYDGAWHDGGSINWISGTTIFGGGTGGWAGGGDTGVTGGFGSASRQKIAETFTIT